MIDENKKEYVNNFADGMLGGSYQTGASDPSSIDMIANLMNAQIPII